MTPDVIAACGVALSLLVAGASARADDVSYDITESLFADWHWRLDDSQLEPADRKDVVDFRNRLNARVRWNQWTFGLRLDAALFVNAPSAQYESDVRPEELFAAWEASRWKVLVGDDYLTVGRGMALSLRKVDEIGFSTALRGLHVAWRGPVQVRFGVGLTNAVNVDLVEEKLVPDPNDLVFLGRVEGEVVKGLRLGLHAVDIERRHSDVRNALTGTFLGGGDDDDDPIAGRRHVRSTIVGADARFGVDLGDGGGSDRLEAFVEGDFLLQDETRRTLRGDEPAGKDGSALYASVVTTLGATTILAEAKRYKHYAVASSLHPDTAESQGVTQTFPYIAPPSLERIDQRVVNNSDVTGAHVRVDHALAKTGAGTSNTLFVSAAGFVDAPAEGEWTFHGYLGWERSAAGGRRLTLQSGLRWEEAPDSGITRLRMIHVDLDWSETLMPGVDLQTHWTHELRTKNIGAPSLEESYMEGTFYLSLGLGSQWSVTGQVEYLSDQATENPVFPGAFVQWKWDGQSFVRLFAGRSKGGLKCSGGICRVFPDFDGLKLESTLRF